MKMAQIIQLTEKEFAELRTEFEQALKLIKVADGKVNFQKSFTSFDRKAVLYFTHDAYEKMQALVQGFDKEVAWHGVAERLNNDGEDAYLISDILVYPQTVTGTTVDMDEKEYDEWIRNNAEDERMYHLRMQGHSHVNMGVSASSVDLKHQADILRMIPKNGFYIFIIINKKNDINVKIYDLRKNVLFEEKDVSVKVLQPEPRDDDPVFTNVTDDEEKALRSLLNKLRAAKRTEGFVSEAKKMVKEQKPYTPPASGYTYGGYAGAYSYGAYQSAFGTAALPSKEEQKPDAKKEEPKAAEKKRKGRRKDKKNTPNPVGFQDDPYDEEEDWFDYWKHR